MSGEISVVSRSQIIVIEPTTSAVSVINAGPMGPAGPQSAFVVLTQSQYDAIPVKDPSVIYVISDAGTSDWVTLTQAQYDALPVKDPDVVYVISDVAEGRARLWRSTTQPIATSTSWTTVVFNTEVIDTGTFIDIPGQPTRITLPTTGEYMVGFEAAWGTITGGERDARVTVNGGAVVCRDNSVPLPNFETVLTATTMYHFVSGDYLELSVRQNSGISINLNTNSPAEAPTLWVYGPL